MLDIQLYFTLRYYYEDNKQTKYINQCYD